MAKSEETRARLNTEIGCWLDSDTADHSDPLADPFVSEAFKAHERALVEKTVNMMIEANRLPPMRAVVLVRDFLKEYGVNDENE